MKRLTVIILALAAIAATAMRASGQQIDGPPVLDMGRLYQIVGYYYDIDPGLLAAIDTAESKGNPAAVSPKGAQGLMKLMPGTAKRYRVDHPFDPVENVFGAARFLTGLRAWSRMQAPFGEVDLPAMIAAYNAGPGAVEKYGGIPPYAETQAYVRKVLWLYLMGQPLPHRLTPLPPPGRPAYSAAPQHTRRHHRPATASLTATPQGTVEDQLAEIKRQRAAAKSRETTQRAQLGLR